MTFSMLLGLFSIASIIGKGILVPVGNDLSREDLLMLAANSSARSRLHFFIQNLSKRPPSCARGSTLCAGFDSYPKEYLTIDLDDKLKDFIQFFGAADVELGDSNGENSVDEYPMCSYEENVIFPQLGKTTDNKWLPVVNRPGYEQGVRVELCLRPRKQCLFSDLIDHNAFRSSCMQKFYHRKLIGLNERGDLGAHSFLIPSACVCTLKPVELMDRFGGRLLPVSPAKSKKSHPAGDV